MVLKQLKRLVIGGAALVALAVGGSASARAATGTSGSSSAAAMPQEALAADGAARAGAASVRGGSVGALNHVRDSWVHELYLTDRELNVGHRRRRASRA